MKNIRTTISHIFIGVTVATICEAGNFFESGFTSADTVKSNINAAVYGYFGHTGDNSVPFWLRSNQFGNIPLSGTSGAFRAQLSREFRTPADKKFFDWGAAIDGRLNLGNHSKFTLIEGYVKARLGIVQLKAGRSRQLMGLVDSTLSVGAFSVSGNALGIPSVELSIPSFYSPKFLNQVLSFKGNFAHGWIGDVGLVYDSVSTHAKTYFHQKSLYVRIGRPNWKVKLYGGFNHQVFFGNERQIYGDTFKLSPAETYFYVVTGKTALISQNGLETGKVGNHLGSIDLGFELDAGNVNLLFYRQNFYDVGALSKLANIKDGLNGLTISNRSKATDNYIRWNKFLFEFLYTVSQAGELDAKFTKSGDENYYNGFYSTGWSYKGIGLGTPFISAENTTRSGFPNDPKDYFNNNRVSAINLGADVSLRKISLLCKISYSRNYGTYGTSAIGHTLGKVRRESHGIFPKVSQFSAYAELSRNINKGYNISLITAVDSGRLLYNSTGVILSVKKTFISY